MEAEKIQKEVSSRAIQCKPGRGKVYMEDNRLEAVGQTKFINTIQLKEKNQLYPIIQRTKITKIGPQSSSESSSDDTIDLEKEEDVNSLLLDLTAERGYSADIIGEALRFKIANSYGHPDATWDQLFGDYLTDEDRKTMTEVWNDWFREPVPWVVGDEEEDEEEEKEKKAPPYKGKKIKPHRDFVGDPGAIHIHIIKDKTHLKLGGTGKRFNIHDNNWESDCKKALSELLKSGSSAVSGFDDCLSWLCQEVDYDVDAVKEGRIALDEA